MRSSAPALLPLFRSQHQVQLLAELLNSPGVEFTVGELSQRAAVPLSTTVRETQRLVTAGILRDRHIGRNRLISADPANPITGPLSQLIVPAFGVPAVIAEQFSSVPGADTVIIFGSWAARFHGEPGHAPRDIDVLVIGTNVSQLDAMDAAAAAEQRLHSPVVPVLATPGQWANPQGAGDPLLAEIQHRPTVVAFEH